MIVYKVVAIRLGKFVSAIMNHEDNPGWMLEYTIGEITYPKVGYIYAFKDLDPSWRFIKNDMFTRGSIEVLKCEGEFVDASPKASFSFLPQNLEKFWSNLNVLEKKGSERWAPEGSVWCEWIKHYE